MTVAKRTVLQNKPLVEALFALKWDLKQDKEESKEEYLYDPYFKLLIGMFWANIKDQFPHFEELDTSDMPDDFGAYVPQFKFSKTPDEYPYVLLGPGIISVHDSEKYVWDDFKEQIFLIIDSFFKSYPNLAETTIIDYYIRYVDAITFDFQKESILDFPREQMKIKISMEESIFQNTSVIPIPQSIDLRFSYLSKDPASAVHLRFLRGGEEGERLVWETIVQVYGTVPQTNDEIKKWTVQSHDLSDEIFFNIIEGKLKERFA
jgi:uncharacterized protein (TIGR04255 family)